jgi:hypothetical protein
MIKFLFIAALVSALIFLARSGLRRTAATPEPRAAGPGPAAPSLLRRTAWTLVGVLLGISLLMSAVQWWQDRDVVEVRVVNSISGSGVSYLVRKSDLGERGFRTLDGRIVTLAEVERMEVAGE